jgi:hypothetical protein
MTEIRMVLREDELTGVADMLVNLGDVVTWLDLLPSLTGSRIPADVSREIRMMLYDAAVTPSEQPGATVATA